MSPRRNLRKTDHSEHGNRKGPESLHESSDESADSEQDDSPPQLEDTSDESESYYEVESSMLANEKCCNWWVHLGKKARKERVNCIRIHVLSPFLFGVVPPGLEDKLIDWSYECDLLPSKDIQQLFTPTDRTFETIRIVEVAFGLLIDYCDSKYNPIRNVLSLREEFMKFSSAKEAINFAEKLEWFQSLRRRVKQMPKSKKEMGGMSLLLAVYHLAAHIKLSINYETDALQRYKYDCKQAEEKALELKKQGNMEFTNEKYRAAISRYSRAVGLSPFNHIVYGNRAQSYLKLENYRQALIDAERALVLKPDWDKGLFRFRQAAKVLQEIEGEQAASLLFFAKRRFNIGPEKESSCFGNKVKNSEIPKGKLLANGVNDEDSDGGSLPDLVSPDDSDTSIEDDVMKKGKETGMPDLVEEDDNSNESGLDEDGADQLPSEKRNGVSGRNMGKIVAALLREQEKKAKKAGKETPHKDKEKIEKEKVEAEKKGNNKKEKETEAKGGKAEKGGKGEKGGRGSKQAKEAEKAKLAKEVKEVSPIEILLPAAERKAQVEGILREGSKALLDNLFDHAFESYSKALGIIDTGSREYLDFGEQSYVIVLYAYGTAMLELGVQKELETAKSTFENIIKSFKSVNFPLAYYGLGKVYHRQNRFHEAIKPLEEGLHIVQGRSFECVYWPGTDIVIEETKDGNLKVAFERILTICKYPPKPDATCRFDKCNGLKKSIYKGDPDYKGYVQVLCNDSCAIEYHVHCWKKLKAEYTGKSSDKDFLDCDCFTVDCPGNIINIRVFDTQGLKNMTCSDKPKVKKDKKPEKNVPTGPTGSSKKKKRSKKKESRAESLPEQDLVLEEALSRQASVEENLEQKPAKVEEKPAIPEKKEKESAVVCSSISKSLNNSDKIPGRFVLKKTDAEEIPPQTKQGKGKCKKKKTKNVQTLEEFLGRDSEHYRPRPLYFDDEDYDEIPSEPFTREPPPGWMSNPFSIPAHLHSEAQEIESSLSSFSTSHEPMYRSNDPWKRESIKEYVYSAFIQLLKVEGPLHIDSDSMKSNLTMMPDEARKLVQDEGGLWQFLSKSSLFTIDMDIVTTVEEKLYRNLSKSLKKPQHERSNYVMEKGSGNKSLEDLSLRNGGVHMGPSTVPNPQGMDSLCDIEEVSPVTSDLAMASRKVKSELHAVKSDLNYMSSTRNSDIHNNNKLSNSDQNAKKTDRVVTWDAETYSVDDLGFSKDRGTGINGLPAAKDQSLGNAQLNDENVKLDNIPSGESGLSTLNSGESCSHGAISVSDNQYSSVGGSHESVVKCAKESAVSGHIDTTSSHLSDKEFLVNLGKGSNEKRLNNKLDFDKLNQSGLNQAATGEGAVHTEAKCTKNKGIQTEPSLKNKLTMTEPMAEPYKVEYEKILRENENWIARHQEAMDKNVQLQNGYNLDVLNLNKKLQEITNQKQASDKKNEELESRYHQESKVLQQERREKNEQIQKLQDQLRTITECEEKRVTTLKVEISVLEARYQKEKEQVEKEKEDAEKFKTLSQQQSQRASNAEVQLLELQRDVSYSFYTRALHEAEVTLHNVNQALAVNPSSQLYEIRQKWQRYMTDCKHQMNHNKTQFETFIPKLKEGKPLATLTSLRIVRPGPYPSPPILQLPSGGVPLPGVKPVNPVQTGNVKSEATGMASGAGTSTLLVPPVVRPDGHRGVKPQSSAASKTVGAFGSAPEHNLRKVTEQTLKVSNSFEKIMVRLSTLFPTYSRPQMTNFIKEVRSSKNGSLTGLSFDDIVACVTQLVKARESQNSQNSSSSGSKERQPLTASASLLKPTSSSSKPSVAMSREAEPSGLGAAAAAQGAQASGEFTYEEDPCVICHDEMTNTTRNVSLDCGHRFHHDCIKKWLIGEQSTCPTCRVHALLPEEFPQLK